MVTQGVCGVFGRGVLRVSAGVCGEGQAAVAADAAEAGWRLSVFGDGPGGVVFPRAGGQDDAGGAKAAGCGLACGPRGVSDGCAAEPAFCDGV